jgi:hypothetical protein
MGDVVEGFGYICGVERHQTLRTCIVS